MSIATACSSGVHRRHKQQIRPWTACIPVQVQTSQDSAQAVSRTKAWSPRLIMRSSCLPDSWRPVGRICMTDWSFWAGQRVSVEADGGLLARSERTQKPMRAGR